MIFFLLLWVFGVAKQRKVIVKVISSSAFFYVFFFVLLPLFSIDISQFVWSSKVFFL